MNSESLLLAADVYAGHLGLSIKTVSTYASGSGDTFDRLKSGKTITMRRYNRVMQWFSDNWPADLPWPIDIPRPAPAPESPAATATQAADPLAAALALDAKGRIKSPADVCAAIYQPRYLYDQVLRQYADGKPRQDRQPHRNSASARLLALLVQSGDVRFTVQRKRAAMFDGLMSGQGIA